VRRRAACAASLSRRGPGAAAAAPWCRRRCRVGRSAAYPTPPCLPYTPPPRGPAAVATPSAGCACVRATAWVHLAATKWAPGGGVAFAVAVSRFFCFPIQMNFAENQKWPSSRRWRGRPTDGVGESMRRGQSKRRAPPGKPLRRPPAPNATGQPTSLGGGDGERCSAPGAGPKSTTSTISFRHPLVPS